MRDEDDEEKRLRSVALQNAQSILLARQRRGGAAEAVGVAADHARQHRRRRDQHRRRGEDHVPQRRGRVADRVDPGRGRGPAPARGLPHRQRRHPPAGREPRATRLAGGDGRGAGEPHGPHRPGRDRTPHRRQRRAHPGRGGGSGRGGPGLPRRHRAQAGRAGAGRARPARGAPRRRGDGPGGRRRPRGRPATLGGGDRPAPGRRLRPDLDARRGRGGARAPGQRRALHPPGRAARPHRCRRIQDRQDRREPAAAPDQRRRRRPERERPGVGETRGDGGLRRLPARGGRARGRRDGAVLAPRALGDRSSPTWPPSRTRSRSASSGSGASRRCGRARGGTDSWPTWPRPTRRSPTPRS